MEEYMLPCLTKKYFGFDCLGCGLQRSAAFILQGDFVAAFKMYPAIYTIILFAFVIILNAFIKFRYSEQLKAILIVINIVLIVGNFVFKIINQH